MADKQAVEQLKKIRATALFGLGSMLVDPQIAIL
jgi:hypothetical protein